MNHSYVLRKLDPLIKDILKSIDQLILDDSKYPHNHNDPVEHFVRIVMPFVFLITVVTIIWVWFLGLVIDTSIFCLRQTVTLYDVIVNRIRTGAWNIKNKKGIVLVVSGPSGVGKDTIINSIIAHSNFIKIPSYTTRSPRHGEVNGIHYHFVDDSTFLDFWNSGYLLDHVVITGYRYGFPISDLRRLVREGKNVIVHLVQESACKLKEVLPDATLIFLLPPSQNDILERLRKRGMTEEQIVCRLRDDPTGLVNLFPYDLVIKNPDKGVYDVASRILDFALGKNSM